MVQIIFLILSLFCISLIYTFFSVGGMKNKLEKFILSISIYISVFGLLALVLTILGVYSLYSLSIFSFLAIAGFSLYFYISGISFLEIFRLEPVQWSVGDFALAIILILIAYLYFFFPTESILGGRDNGVYILLGTYISKTGGLNLNDPLYSKLVPILGDSIHVGYPGIYSNYTFGFSGDIGSLTAQFYHLFPAYLAIGYDLFGMEGLLRTNGFFGILSLLFIFAIVRRLIGVRGALVCVLLCGLNPAQIWNIRTTLSEPLSQFVILFFLYMVERTMYRKNLWAVFFSGLLLGINSFNRIDSLILFPALFSFCLYIAFFAKRYLKKSILLFQGFTLLSCFAILYGILYSKPYFWELWKKGSLDKLVLISGVSIFLTYTLWFSVRFDRIREKIRVTKEFIIQNERVMKIILYVLFFGLLVYGYYLRPLTYPEGWAGSFKIALATKSFPIFLWYVPIAIFVFAVFGYVRIFFRSRRIDLILMIFLGTILLLGYLYDPSISPDHFWVSRRWILFSIPFALILGAIGIFSIPIFTKSITNLVLILVVLYSLCFSIWRSKLFLLDRMLGGFSEELRRASENLPRENAVYFTADQNIAGPLKYIYGRPTYLIGNTQNFLDRIDPLLDQGLEIYLIQSTAYFGSHPKLNFEPISEIKWSGLYPVATKERFPDMMSRVSTHQNVYRIRKNNSGKEQKFDISYEWKMGEAGFQTHSGEFGGNFEIRATKKEGSLVYGPYLTLPKGKYEIIFQGNYLKEAKFRITANNGSVSITEWEDGDNDENKKITFSVSEPELRDIEFKVNVPGKSNVIVSKVYFKRLEN